MDYVGKSAIITGGATGIGRSLAILLAKAGAKIAIVDIDQPNSLSTVEQIKSTGGIAVAYQCDIADQDQVTDVFTKAFGEFGRIEFAFINAGVVQLAKLADLSAADLEWMFRVNVFGAFYCARCFIEETRETGNHGAHITFTGSENSLSIPAFARHTQSGGYNMTKHAVLSMAEVFRFELENENIGVSLAVPGGVKTDIIASIKKRQEAFGGPGTTVFPDMDALPSDVEIPPTISADEAADLILKGVADKQFYIPTHAHVLQDFLQRAAEIEGAFRNASLPAADG